MIPIRYHVGPEHWRALNDRSPATECAWVNRLGRPAGVLAVRGAIARGELRMRGDGLYELREQPEQLLLF